MILLGTACGYRQGAFAVTALGEFPPVRTTVGCLDLGVGLDPESTRRAPRIRYAFGNGCDHRIRLDLAAIRVEGRDREGRPVALQARNAAWAGVRHLSARWFARELILYEPVDDVALGAVCIDISGLYEGSGTRLMCLEVA